MKKKIITKFIPLLFLTGLPVFCGLKPGNPLCQALAGQVESCNSSDDKLLVNLALLLLSTPGAAGPSYEITETTMTPAVPVANYYTAGVTAYADFLSSTQVGTTNPTVIYQAEQTHGVGNAWVDFLQSVDGGALFATRNSVSAGAQTGTVAHFYGADTSIYTTTTASGSPGGLFVNTAYAQDPNAVNIYFVKSETAVGGVLGIAGGIPGLPGKTGTRNSAMVIIFDSHLGTAGASPSAAEQTLIGETIAHEAGHWLGMNHLVESVYNVTQNNYTRDGISETPRCAQTPVSLTNCDSTGENNSGARNIMFWAGMAGFSQPDLTGEQGWVLRRHPLVY